VGVVLSISSVLYAEAPIKIGATLSLSGGYGGTGVGHQHGMLFAQHKINEGGGILGRKLEVVILDNESQPVLANNTARRLIEVDRACVILPTAGSPIANAVVPVCEELKVPMIAIYSSDPKAYLPLRPFVFQYHIDTVADAEAIGFFLQALRIHKITLLYIDNAWGRGLKDLMMAEEYKKRYELQFVVDFIPVPADVKDLTVQVNRLKDFGKIEAVVLAPNTPITTAFLKARNIANWDVKALVLGPFVEEALGMLGSDYGYNAWQRSVHDPTGTLKAISRTVVDEGIKYFGKRKWAMDECFAGGHDGVMIAAEAIKRGGSTDPRNIRDSLENNLNGWGKGVLLEGNAETVIHWTSKYHGGIQGNEVVWEYWVKGKREVYR
jgi:branched-chain amino acid transport system substrate-binding protein